MRTVEFTCPRCGKHQLDEITRGTATTEISNLVVGNNGIVDCEYGPTLNDDTEIIRYQCSWCGHVLLVTDLEELVELLDQQGE